MSFRRCPAEASSRDYDIVVIGGGVYGVMVALQASLRGCRTLLLERADYGGATSYNSLRIIHGGLRELQTLDLKRYWRFARERRWFLERYPGLVDQLPVLVPLYQRGVFRTGLFRAAFFLDRFLLPERDRKLQGVPPIPQSEVLSPSKVNELFPRVDPDGLSGGALWHDATVDSSQRLIVEALRDACRLGATAVNYMPVTDLRVESGRVVGVRARDVLEDELHDVSADFVVNAAGPWSRSLARRFDEDRPHLYRRSVAWNVLIDQEPLSRCALGVRTPRPSGRRYFIRPWKGRVLAGTGHSARSAPVGRSSPTSEELSRFLEDLNAAIPSVTWSEDDIVHVYSGSLPVKDAGTISLQKQDRVIDHGAEDGPRGLFSVGSSKLTAARSTAERVVRRMFPDRGLDPDRLDLFNDLRSREMEGRGWKHFDTGWHMGSGELPSRLFEVVENEAVHHLDDLVLRRTSLGDRPRRALRSASRLCGLFDWSPARRRREVERLEDHFSWLESSPHS